MEQTTLQQRIEERASKRLTEVLYAASQKLESVGNTIGLDFRPQFHVTLHYGYNNEKDYVLRNDATKEIFNKLLPNYIRMVTDEVLEKIDQIDYLLEENRSYQEP